MGKIMMEKLYNYIGGELISPISNSYIENINPANGKVYSLIPDSDSKDVQLAVAAAKKAFPAWSAMPVQKRSDLLLKIALLIEKNLEALALAESIDNGKPVWLAKSVDIPRAVSNFRFYATAILHFNSEAHFTDRIAINYTQQVPLGVVACISPWNLPLYLFTWKIAPALASGNCVVAKPSELTPMTAFLLSKLCIEAGLPTGVLNIVHGLGPKAGQAMVEHHDIKAISFTGGTATGKRIASIAAPEFKKLSLELGGKNPNIVFDDADFDSALDGSLKAGFSNQGQICLCGSRLLVQESIYSRFRDALVAKVSKMKVGDPMDEATKVGALVSEGHMQKVLSYIDLAKQEGGKVLCGGERVYPGKELDGGFYLAPTIIEGLDQNCRTNQEEIFGPVLSIQSFEDEEEALQMANNSAYGLSATLWTSNLKRAHDMAHKLEAGIIWVNSWLLRDLRTPFGGLKQSGLGREGGMEAFKFFTEQKNICIRL
jgi:aminomuconate-semialdehyde/2-hydroxymuconate-6-semialdehyde dehydrogenase